MSAAVQDCSRIIPVAVLIKTRRREGKSRATSVDDRRVFVPDGPIRPAFAQEQIGEGQGPNQGSDGPGQGPKAEGHAEDLMREHGVLECVLLIYEGGMRKFEAGDDFDPAIPGNSAQIVQEFVSASSPHERSDMRVRVTVS